MRNFSAVPVGTVIDVALLLQVASAGMLARQFEPAESQTCFTNCRVAEVTVTFPELVRLTPPPPGSVAWLTAAWTPAGHNTRIIKGATRIPFRSTPAKFKGKRFNMTDLLFGEGLLLHNKKSLSPAKGNRPSCLSVIEPLRQGSRPIPETGCRPCHFATSTFRPKLPLSVVLLSFSFDLHGPLTHFLILRDREDDREGLVRLKSQALVRLPRNRSHRQRVQLTVRIGVRD